MATLNEFLRTGQLGQICLGINPFEAETLLGEPQDRSRKKNPLELKYGSLRLTFWKHTTSERSQLMEIALCFQPVTEELPETVRLTDFSPNENTSEKRFRAFLEEINYLPVHMVEGAQTHLILPSGVVASFSDSKLNSLRRSQQQTKERTPSPLSDLREPSIEHIQDMLVESRTLFGLGYMRVALVLAWAALEAALRRVALAAGLQGRIGVQANILIRELLSARILSRDEAAFLEQIRQLRTSIAHGLAPQPFDTDIIPQIIDLADRIIKEPVKA